MSYIARWNNVCTRICFFQMLIQDILVCTDLGKDIYQGL